MQLWRRDPGRRPRRGPRIPSSRTVLSGLVSLPLAACGPAAGSGLAVVGRLAGPGVETSPELEPVPRLLGGQQRPALCGESAETFRSRAEHPVTRVDLALGLAAGGGGARFRVLRGEGDDREAVLDVRLEPEADGWHAHRIDLAAPLAAGEVLEFRAEGAAGARPCWGGVAFLGPPPDGSSRPAIVLISLDTLGAAQLGALGGPAGVSPQIDAFLARAFAFRRAYASYPSTFTSHSTLLSGLDPVRHGRYPGSTAPLASLVGEFAEAGYLTAGFTEDAYVGSAYGFGRGFDLYDDGAVADFRAISGNAPRTFARAEEWLRRFGDATRTFLFVHTYEVHSPYVPRDEVGWRFADALTPDDRRRYSGRDAARAVLQHNSGASPLDQRERRRLAALHAGEVHQLDGVVGAFLRRLEARSAARPTLVVLTSDHGEEFGEHGAMGHGTSLHEPALHVPLAFAWPGEIAAGIADGPVGLVDVLPTLLDLAELPVPPDLDGRSLVARLRGAGPPAARPVFAELQSTRRACRGWRGPGPCRLDRYAVWTDRFKYVSSGFPRYERLYDLAVDPGEERDVASTDPGELARHRALLTEYVGRAPAARPEPEPAPVDEATRARLRALGYLE